MSEQNVQTAKPKKKRNKVKARMALNRWLRLALQVVFLLLAPGAWASAMNGVHYLAAQVGAAQPIEAVSFLVTLVAVLAYTVVFGRFFCGYACAFGTLGDVLFQLGAPLRALLKPPSPDEHPALLACLRGLKYALLLVICIMCFCGVWDRVATYNPWSAFGVFLSGSLEGLNMVGLALLVPIMVGQLLWERSFCRFLCPLGALFSLMPVLPCSQFTRNLPRCGKKPCQHCLRACPVGILPDAGSVASGECIACGRCCSCCPLENVHLIAIEKPAPALGPEAATGTEPASTARRPQFLLRIRGTEVATVLAKAALLLVLLWSVGAVRFVPGPAELLPWLPWL